MALPRAKSSCKLLHIGCSRLRPAALLLLRGYPFRTGLRRENVPKVVGNRREQAFRLLVGTRFLPGIASRDSIPVIGGASPFPTGAHAGEAGKGTGALAGAAHPACAGLLVRRLLPGERHVPEQHPEVGPRRRRRLLVGGEGHGVDRVGVALASALL